MKEIEILVEVYDEPSKIIEKLDNFEFKGVKETIDVYYYDPKRDNLKPNKDMQIDECLRIRTKNNEHYITYKVDKFDEAGKWLYSDEYETKFDDLFMLNNIINKLGFKELLTIHNSKRTYENGIYEIVLETVKDLGYFLEVEYCTNEDVDVKEVKKEIQKFIDSLELNVSEELNMGKPEMMIRKNNSDMNKIKGKCKECKILDKCKGGCRACAFQIRGDFDDSDPRCPIAKGEIDLNGNKN